MNSTIGEAFYIRVKSTTIDFTHEYSRVVSIWP